MMRPILIFATILAVFGIAVMVTGYLLAPTRVGVAERRLPGPPSLVAAVIADVASQPDWRSGIASVDPSPDGWIERTDSGEEIRFRPAVLTADRIELRFESTRGYHGFWVGEMIPQEDGTLLRVTESATTPSPLGRILSRLFFNPQSYASAYLDALHAEVARRRERT